MVNDIVPPLVKLSDPDPVPDELIVISKPLSDLHTIFLFVESAVVPI